MTTRHSQAAGAQTPNGPGSEAITLCFANQRKNTSSLSAFGDESAAEHLRNALQILTSELAAPAMPVAWLIVRDDGSVCDGAEMGSRASAEATAARYAANSRRGPYTVEPLYRSSLEGRDAELTSADLDAARDRIRKALFQIERPPLVTYDVTAAGRAELEQLAGAMLPPTLPRDVACRYCGCKQESACAIDVEQLSDDARNAVELYYLSNNAELPGVVPCWWVSITPPVCSAPSCVASFREYQDSRLRRVTGRTSSELGIRPLATRGPEFGGPV